MQKRPSWKLKDLESQEWSMMGSLLPSKLDRQFDRTSLLCPDPQQEEQNIPTPIMGHWDTASTGEKIMGSPETMKTRNRQPIMCSIVTISCTITHLRSNVIPASRISPILPVHKIYWRGFGKIDNCPFFCHPLQIAIRLEAIPISNKEAF